MPINILFKQYLDIYVPSLHAFKSNLNNPMAGTSSRSAMSLCPTEVTISLSALILHNKLMRPIGSLPTHKTCCSQS